MNRRGIVVLAVLIVLAATAPAGAVTGLVSNGGNNLGPGDDWNLGIGVTHSGPAVVVDIYLVLVAPGGTPIFFTIGPGGLSLSPTPVPLATGVPLTDGVNTGLIPLLSLPLTDAVPAGLYQTVLAFTTSGTTNVVDTRVQPFFVVHAPVGAALGTYTGSWMNLTFATTGPAVFQVLDTAAGIITFSIELGGSVFGIGPTSFTLPVNLQAGNTVNASTAFGTMTATAGQDLGSFQGVLTFTPGGPISAMTFTGTLANGAIHVDYTISFTGGGTATGVVNAARP
jgi:hypothetical protein